MILGEFTVQDIPEIEPEANVRQAADALRTLGTPLLAVMDRGRMIGTLSESNLARVACSGDVDPARIKVSEICNREPLTCHADTPLSTALSLMARERSPGMLVSAADGTVVGVVSVYAMLEFLLETVPEEATGPEPEYVHQVRGDQAD